MTIKSLHPRAAHRRPVCHPSLILLLAAAGSVLPIAAGASHDAVLSAAFSGMQEVPANASTAIGGGIAMIDTDTNTLAYHFAFAGLSSAETGAHIHGPANPGANGGVLVALPAGNPKVGVWTYPEAVEADILAGRTYVNIHTANFGGGEIRGQLVTHNAQLDGEQEVPANGSPARGWGVFTLDTDLNELRYYIAFSGLSSAETSAHIHGSALHGANAGVLVALPAGSPKVGVYTYPEAQEAAICAGQTYVNIHTTNFGGGEIRGQIVPRVLPLDGGQEVPPNASPGAGVGLIALDYAGDVMTYDLRYTGLSSAETAAHIHGFAPPGQNAGVQMAMPAGPRKLGSWPFGAANQGAVFAGLSYFNVHTVNFGGGEIRGQILADVACALPVANVSDGAPASGMTLSPNVPNPFQGQTTLAFTLDGATAARVAVYDAQGRLVRNIVDGDFAAGPHSIVWDGRDESGRAVASGSYLYVLHTPEGAASGRLTLTR